MGRQKTFVVKLKRKREGKTNYPKRMRLLLNEKPRLVIRKTSKNISLQIIEYKPNGDQILIAAHTKELEKLGWTGSRKNIPAAYLCGLLLAKKAIAKGIKTAIADFGLQKPLNGSKLYAALKGAIEGGLKINAPDSIMPSEDRLLGKHISSFKKHVKESKSENLKTQFSNYTKNGLEPENIEKQIKDIKNKILA